MSHAARVRRLCLIAALLVAPAAQADDDCRVALGRGWPAATENYGTAVEQLFAAGTSPRLAFTLLPRSGVESGVLLIPSSGGGDWTLRRAVADERVHQWSATHLELRTEQTPEFEEAPIPETVAQRLIAEWHRALAAVAPDGSTAPFREDDTWLFFVDDATGEPLRVSGLRPGCDLGERLRDQIDLLIEASDEGPDKRAKRWRQLGESLDRMREAVDAMSPAAPSGA